MQEVIRKRQEDEDVQPFMWLEQIGVSRINA